MSKISFSKLPHDERDHRYTKSFSVDQADEYKAFFEEHGVVVIRDVLNPEECTSTVDEIWTYAEKSGWNPSLGGGKIKRDDPSTWDGPNWAPMANEGILGPPPVFMKQALLNRQNRNVYEVHASLLGRKDLVCNHDRYGLFRPTVGVKLTPDSEPQLMDDWRTTKNLHLDMNPWGFMGEHPPTPGGDPRDLLTYRHDGDFIEENNFLGHVSDGIVHTQALINLLDNEASDGGFMCVPGFAKNLGEWMKTEEGRELESIYGSQMTFIVFPYSNEMYEHAVRITARAGSLVVWNQVTAHGSSPNASLNPRMAQFLKFSVAPPAGSERARRRQERLKTKISREEVCTWENSAKILGIEDWC